MPLPITHREQHLSSEMQARFYCPERRTFTDTIELGGCFGLWVVPARILNSTFRDSGRVTEGVREPLQQGSGDFDGLRAWAGHG